MKEKLVYYIAQTYINSLGEASVSVQCYKPNNQLGLHWSRNLLDENIVYYDSEEQAKKMAYGMWANTDMTVHSRYIEVTDDKKGE